MFRSDVFGGTLGWPRWAPQDHQTLMGPRASLRTRMFWHFWDRPTEVPNNYLRHFCIFAFVWLRAMAQKTVGIQMGAGIFPLFFVRKSLGRTSQIGP